MSNILYLLNHKTLTDFEVPILIKKGYGVYIPKRYSSLSLLNSINYTTVNFYDNFVHIPPSDITVFNNIDWFSNKPIDPDIINILNIHFKYIFITLLTEPPLLNQLIKQFNGTIYYRMFGLDGLKSYVGTINKYVSPNVKYIFSYPEIYQYEKQISNFFNEINSHVIPLGLSNSLVTKLYNMYDRKNNKITFICSRISPKCQYYFKIFQNFVKEFKEFDYTIIGKNNEIAFDKNIQNNLSDDDFYRSISQCACMYYHGKEPRHLHYHPLEAIIIGIPIIFHQESLLTRYLENSPGKCCNIDSVRDKIYRIINRDDQFIAEILAEQKKACRVLLQYENIDIFNCLL